MSSGLSRRQFLVFIAGGIGVVCLALARVWAKLSTGWTDKEVGKTTLLPTLGQEDYTRIPSIEPEVFITGTSSPTTTTTPDIARIDIPKFGPKVLHIHAPHATSWDFGDNYYGDYVNQEVVDEMVDRGVCELTGRSSVSDAWRMLIPVYKPNQTTIAIKVNLNNSFWCDIGRISCEEWQLKIDALIHPVNAIIHGLKEAYPNLDHSDILVYDATIGKNPPVSNRQIPRRFKSGCLYSGVSFFDQGCSEKAAYLSKDTTASIVWHIPDDIPEPPKQSITDVLVDATYLINIPILKKHGGAGVSLGFKNHFGSIDNCHLLHDWTCFTWDAKYYSNEFNPLVDISLNPNIRNKTVLTIGDGLYGDRAGNINKPTPWRTFNNNASNSLFFSTDPVAIDSVMCDFLHEEGHQGGLPKEASDYLRLAHEAELGVYESGNPWKRNYGKLEYIRVDL